MVLVELSCLIVRKKDFKYLILHDYVDSHLSILHTLKHDMSCRNTYFAENNSSQIGIGSNNLFL